MGDGARSGTDRVKQISAAELAGLIGTDKEPFLLDVREPEEVAAWAIPGAVDIPLGVLPARLHELPVEREVVVVCASGNRSSRATAFLAKAGYSVANLTGGMAAWGRVYDTAFWTLSTGQIVQVRRRGKGCLSYVVGAEGAAVVVDPSSEISQYGRVAADRGWRITGVMDTHLHADHVSGVRMLAEELGVPTYRGDGDNVRYPFEPVGDGSTIAVGARSLTVWAAPGHTGGSIVLEAPDGSLLTGDTLFVDGVGRPDLAEHAETDARALYRSIGRLLAGRDGAASVFPAHFSESVEVVPGTPVSARLADVQARVPQLAWEEPAFVAWAAGRAAPRPPRYEEIIRVNTGERTVSPEQARDLELGPNRCAAA